MSADPSQTLGPNTLTASETEGLRSLIESWTSHLVAGRIAEWQSFWAEEAVLMPAGHQRVAGRSNIVDYATHEFPPLKSFRFSDWSFAGGDDLAVVANQIELDTDGQDGPSVAAYNQIIVLRRDADQRWRVQTVIFTPIG